MFVPYRSLCGLLLCAALIAPACADDSLYQRLGGQAAMTQIAGRLIDMTAADPASQRSFQGKVNLPRLKTLLAEQLCSASGGPCRYSGDTMKQVHGGLKISESEFFAMVAHLRRVLDDMGVANGDKNALLALLAPMKRDIVEPQ